MIVSKPKFPESESRNIYAIFWFLTISLAAIIGAWSLAFSPPPGWCYWGKLVGERVSQKNEFSVVSWLRTNRYFSRCLIVCLFTLLFFFQLWPNIDGCIITVEAARRKRSNPKRTYQKERTNMIWWNMQQPLWVRAILGWRLCYLTGKIKMNGWQWTVSIFETIRVLLNSLPQLCLCLVPAVDFFNQINMLYGTITEFCTEESCPLMSAGPKYEYHWADGQTVKKPIKCSAPKYIDYLMTWVQDQLDDENLFPSKIGESRTLASQ